MAGEIFLYSVGADVCRRMVFRDCFYTNCRTSHTGAFDVIYPGSRNYCAVLAGYRTDHVGRTAAKKTYHRRHNVGEYYSDYLVDSSATYDNMEKDTPNNNI